MHSFKSIYKRGVLTVELAFLMPSVLAVIIIVIYAGFYFHDRCVIESIAYRAVLTVSQTTTDEDTLPILSKLYFDDMSGATIMGSDNFSVDSMLIDETITLTVNASFSFMGLTFPLNVSESAYANIYRYRTMWEEPRN